MDGIYQLIIAFISGVLGPILLLYIKHLLDKQKIKPDMVMDTLRVSELVNQKIEHIKEEFGADRVWVSQFHNGGNFYPTGRSMAKFSIVYETVGPNTNSVQTNFKNIPVNLFSKSINELYNNNVIEVPDFKDEKIATFGLKYVAEESNCKSSYLFAIKTIEEKFIGVLSVDFTKRKTKLDADSINHLQNHATAIGGVLMTYLQQ
jgi:hypothetical protein